MGWTVPKKAKITGSVLMDVIVLQHVTSSVLVCSLAAAEENLYRQQLSSLYHGFVERGYAIPAGNPNSAATGSFLIEKNRTSQLPFLFRNAFGGHFGSLPCCTAVESI